MRKSTKILFLIFIILLCALIAYKYYPFGTIEYDDESSNKLIVPKYSNEIEVTDNQIVISSFRSSFILEKEVQDSLNQYEKYSCTDKTLYYNPESNMTIEGYAIDSWGLLNKVTIEYLKGRKIPDDCSKE